MRQRAREPLERLVQPFLGKTATKFRRLTLTKRQPAPQCTLVNRNRRSRNDGQCRCEAKYVVNGLPMCTTHAAYAALEFCIKIGDERELK